MEGKWIRSAIRRITGKGAIRSVKVKGLISCSKACKLPFNERTEERGSDTEQICECENGSDLEKSAISRDTWCIDSGHVH